MEKEQNWLVGRHQDPTPVTCIRCGWKGRQMDAIHTYKPVICDPEDVEPVDLCPICKGEV
jgi:hypothetical protein